MKVDIKFCALAMTTTVMFVILVSSCKKKEEPLTVPVLATTEPSNITHKSATSGGNITSDGGADIKSRGVCWDTIANPTIESSIDSTIDGSGIGVFSSTIEGLQPKTSYFLRAYATNSIGTAYGEELTFTTEPLFRITSNSYSENDDWTYAVRNEFGTGFRVLDWLDLVNYYNQGGDVIEMFDDLGLDFYRAQAFVLRSGAKFYSTGRAYFVERHDHIVPAGWLVHEHIDNHLIDLGSWYGTKKILAIRID